MKNLFLILIGAMLFTSCQKEVKVENSQVKEEIPTGRVGRDTYVHVGVSSSWDGFNPPTDNYKGVSFEADVEQLKMQGDYTKSCWIEIRGRGIVRDVFAQLGFFALDNRSISLAFQVYDLRTRSQISGTELDIQNQTNITIEKGTTVKFEIVNIEGTTRWEFKVNDQLAFDANLGITEGGNFPTEISSENSISLLTETRGGDTFSPPIHIRSLKYFKNGVWNLVPSARAILSVINDATGRIDGWNIKGVGVADFYIGGTPATPPGTLIW